MNDFSIPVHVKFGRLELYIEAGADHLAALFQVSKCMSTESGVLLAPENIFSPLPNITPHHAVDDSGVNAISAPGSQVPPEYCLDLFQVGAAHQHLAGNRLMEMTEYFVGVLGKRVEVGEFGRE